MRFVIVTGMSGAGKSSVLKMLEDVGYYCIDNLPVPLMPKLADLLREPNSEIDKIALGIDIRSGKNFTQVDALLKTWQEDGLHFEVLFLDASNEALIKRYKETRRNHPLSGEDRVEHSIDEERVRLDKVKNKANYIIDTSKLLIRELKSEIKRIFVLNHEFKSLYVTILSFGFKNGIPVDADLVFDVRFLPNPYYIEELKPLSGNDEKVREYVMESQKSKEFLLKLTDMVEFLMPNYVIEGKNRLIVAIGCTGGKHRSVTLANELFESINEKNEYGVRVEHRDIQRENIIKEVQK